MSPAAGSSLFPPPIHPVVIGLVEVPTRILVVDDEPDLEDLLRLHFRKQIQSGQFTFDYAGNGVDALERLQNGSPYDLLLTDLKMPKMDGMSLLATITEWESAPKSIVITAYGDLDNIRRAMNRGAFDFLTKPLNRQDLQITVEKAAESIAAEKARRLETEQVRRRIAQDLHDEMGGDLSSIVLLSEMAKGDDRLGDKTRGMFTEIGNIARKLVADLRDIVWVVHPDYDRLNNMVRKMEDVADTMLAGTTYSFDCPEDAFSGAVDMETRRHIFLIYKEVLHNIMRHAHATSVDIRVRQEEEQLLLSIVDDGVGFDEATVRAGNGLASLRRRAEEAHGRIDIQSRPGVGTSVTLSAVPSRRVRTP